MQFRIQQYQIKPGYQPIGEKDCLFLNDILRAKVAEQDDTKIIKGTQILIDKFELPKNFGKTMFQHTIELSVAPEATDAQKRELANKIVQALSDKDTVPLVDHSMVISMQ